MLEEIFKVQNYGSEFCQVKFFLRLLWFKKERHFIDWLSQENALKKMREGLFAVLPSGALDGLTSKDFCLLVNDVATLVGYTSFNDESGRDQTYYSCTSNIKGIKNKE